MDIKSIIFGLLIGIIAASLIWAVAYADLLAKKEKSEDSWYRKCLHVIAHYDRACDHFVRIIRMGDKKDISDEEVYQIKYF